MRRSVGGIAILLLSVAPGHATVDADEARHAVEHFVRLLEAGDVDGLAALYHPEAAHRDLASGKIVRGRQDLRALLERRLRRGRASSARVRIASLRLLTHDVAIAQLTLSGTPHPEARQEAPPTWPPFTALVLSLEDDSWGVAASRAGGNLDTWEKAVLPER